MERRTAITSPLLERRRRIATFRIPRIEAAPMTPKPSRQPQYRFRLNRAATPVTRQRRPIARRVAYQRRPATVSPAYNARHSGDACASANQSSSLTPSFGSRLGSNSRSTNSGSTGGGSCGVRSPRCLHPDTAKNVADLPWPKLVAAMQTFGQQSARSPGHLKRAPLTCSEPPGGLWGLRDVVCDPPLPPGCWRPLIER
jgi:hypothetical protein